MAARRRKATAQGKPDLPKDVNAALRAKRALELRIQGRDYATIAEMCSYASKSAAYTAIHRELARSLKPPTDELRELEVLRLDALLQTFMPKALKGDGWSCDRVLRIAEARRKLLGLEYAPAQTSATTEVQVVVREYPTGVADLV